MRKIMLCIFLASRSQTKECSMWQRLVFSVLLIFGLLGGSARFLFADDEEKKADDSNAEQTFELKELSLTEAIKQQSELAYSGQRVYLGLEKTDYTEDSTKPAK